MSAKKNYIFTVHEISVDRHLRAMFFFLCRPSTHIVQILQKERFLVYLVNISCLNSMANYHFFLQLV
jgi:hypothetical protein